MLIRIADYQGFFDAPDSKFSAEELNFLKLVASGESVDDTEFKKFTDKFKDDIDIAVLAARVNNKNFQWISENIKNSKVFANAIVIEHKLYKKLPYLGSEVLADHEFGLAVVKAGLFSIWPDVLGGEDKIGFAKKVIADDPFNFSSAPEKLTKNKDIIKFSMSHNVMATFNGADDKVMKRIIAHAIEKDPSFLINAFQTNCLELEFDLVARDLCNPSLINKLKLEIPKLSSDFLIKALENLQNPLKEDNIKQLRNELFRRYSGNLSKEWGIPLLVEQLAKRFPVLPERTAKKIKNEYLIESFKDAFQKEKLISIKKKTDISQVSRKPRKRLS